MDVQPLLDDARAIMGEQVLVENEDNRLQRYNVDRNKEEYETALIYVDLKLVTAKHDFKTGYVDIIYTRKFFERTGECIRYSINIPA